MMQRLMLITIVAAALSAGGATVRTSLGSENDEPGLIPPNADVAKCENALEKALGKALACFAKCHQARASGKLADEAAEDYCESDLNNPSSCKSKFNKTREKLLVSPDCPPSLTQESGAAMDQVFAVAEQSIDGDVNGQVYRGQ